ncbi:restriction endonuclease [Streptomyces niger]|uniref:restriction endonuclease n=1 Tax=Streptomyces niger TaxID=66373 RepID=UPI00069A1A09|nr:restriction endonuclease [Streptomyces niger]
MVTPTRRPRPATRRPAFSLRQLTVCFGLIAIGIVGIGLMLRTGLDSAARHPVASLVVVSAVAALVVGIARSRPRGGASRRVDPRPGDPGFAAESPLVEVENIEEGEEAEAVEAAEETVYVADYAAMDAYEFENAVAALCERDGCIDVEVVGGANDLGADIVATTSDGRTLVVQCKRYAESHKVGSQDLQRFGGTCYTVHGADVAALVTTSSFTDPAIEYAEQCGILCFSGTELTAWATGTGPAPWE